MYCYCTLQQHTCVFNQGNDGPVICRFDVCAYPVSSIQTMLPRTSWDLLGPLRTTMRRPLRRRGSLDAPPRAQPARDSRSLRNLPQKS